MVKSGVSWVLLAALFLPACGDEDDPAPEAIEIEGSWTSQYGDERITSDTWTSFSTQAIVEFSNEENFAIWQNPADAPYFPEMFGRNVWTEIEDGSFYYCIVAYMSETAEATEDDAELADPDDLEMGCGATGSPWTELTRK
jgi:major membrane immunogen (membrane-anchored lipoprotein)